MSTGEVVHTCCVDAYQDDVLRRPLVASLLKVGVVRSQFRALKELGRLELGQDEQCDKSAEAQRSIKWAIPAAKIAGHGGQDLHDEGSFRFRL
jgi:hypothetical protein